ncbi:unnamed protein product [Ixodes persulcatus]
MRTTYFRPPSSMCYTVDANQWSDKNHRFQKCTMPWTWELSLRAAWNPESVLQLQNSEKLPLVIHRTETCPPDRLSSITMKPGLTYTVSVAQRVRTAHKALSGGSVVCWAIPLTAHSPCSVAKEGRALAMSKCIADNALLLRCVQNPIDVSLCNPKYCFFIPLLICDKQITNKTLMKCMKKCGAPCEETSYDVRLTSLGEDRVRCVCFSYKNRISFSVSVKFSSDSQKIFEYQPKLTVIEAFGYMGGYIGMWLGLSLYSLITDGEQWLRTFFTKRALKSSAAK